MAAGGMVGSFASHPQQAWRLVPVAVALAMAAAVTADPVALVLGGATAILVAVGVPRSEPGERSWQVVADTGRLVALLTAALAGRAVGAGWRRLRTLRVLASTR